MSSKLLELGIDGGTGGVLHQGLLLLRVLLGIDHAHVDVDGVHPWNAVADTDGISSYFVTLCFDLYPEIQKFVLGLKGRI